MEILKIIQTLQSYTEDAVAYKLDGNFAHAVTEAVNLLVSQGERIAEIEEQGEGHLMATEKRLIDANALKEKAESEEATGEGIVYVQDIDEAPTVDTVEVVHGRWERCWQEKSKHYFRCSNCLTAYMDGVSGAIGPEYGSRAWRYCPTCGAKMNGGNSDVN